MGERTMYALRSVLLARHVDLKARQHGAEPKE